MPEAPVYDVHDSLRRRARQFVVAAAMVALAVGGLVAAGPAPQAPARAAAASLPTRLSDAEFWALESEISEPGGYFQITDNYTSNEQEVGQLVTMLRDAGVRGGVYIGVGPEQNFSYIAAIHPVMAFIIDIRRQAVMQHLMFKAAFELSRDRADFISLLFAKPRPDGIEDTMSIGQVWQAFSAVRTNSTEVSRNAARIVGQLTKTHGFTFSDEESTQLSTVLDAFARFGPEISTRSGSGRPGISFSDLTGWSLDASGHPQSFLATEDDFQYVKALQEKNLVVPVSGDFGGPKALRAIGAYLHEHGGGVSAYYVSNVEQYLFQDSKLRAFYDNVGTLPLADSSVFIRPYSSRYRFGNESRSLCPIDAFLTAMSQAAMPTYNDSLSCGQ